MFVILNQPRASCSSDFDFSLNYFLLGSITITNKSNDNDNDSDNNNGNNNDSVSDSEGDINNKISF